MALFFSKESSSVGVRRPAVYRWVVTAVSLGGLLSLLFSPGTAAAAACTDGVIEKFWDGGGANDNWDDPLNWTANVVPQPNEDVCIDAGAESPTIVINSSTGTNINSLESREALTINDGTLTLAAASEIDAPNQLTFAGGTITGAGTLTVSGPLSWTAGSMTGAGTTALGGTTTISGAGQKNLNQRTLTNNGTINWGSGDVLIGDGAIVNNSPTGVIDIQGDPDLLYTSPGASGVMNNLGLLKKSAGTGLSSLDVTLNNTATDAAKGVKVQAGHLRFLNGGASTARFESATGSILDFGGGTQDLSTAANLLGAGEIRFSAGFTNFDSGTYNPTGLTSVTGGTVNFNAPASTGSLTFTGGSLGGTNALTVTTGPNSWTAGSFDGTGGTVLNGITTISGAGDKSLSQRTLTNYGTANWTAGNLTVGYAAVITNAATGIIDIKGDPDIVYSSTGAKGELNNVGLLKKSAGADVSLIDMTLDNTGIDPNGVEVLSGRLSFSNGGISWGHFEAQGAGDVLEFSGGTHILTKNVPVVGLGEIRFSGGTTTITDPGYEPAGLTHVTGGTVNFSAPASTGSLTFTGGTIGGWDSVGPPPVESTLSVTTGPNLWTGGAFVGDGETILTGTTTISGEAVKDLSRRTLTNNGTINWLAGDLRFGDGAVFTNGTTGLFDIQPGGAIQNCCTGAKGTFNNFGRLRRDFAGFGGLTNMDVLFNNYGTVELAIDEFFGFYSHTGLTIGGATTLGGTLAIDGLSPPPRSHEFMTFPSGTGCFTSVEDDTGVFYEVVCSSTNVVATSTPQTESAISLKVPAKIVYGKQLTLTGAVTSDNPDCVGSRDIQIDRSGGGSIDIVTDGQGKFTKKITARKSESFITYMLDSGACGGNVSPERATIVKMKVTLKSSDDKVNAGEKVTLTATAAPCGNHAGFVAKLFKRIGSNGQPSFVEKKDLNGQCKVSFERKINNPTQFKVEVIAPQGHTDHATGASAWRPVGIR